MGSRRSRPAHTRGCGRYAALLRPQGPSGTRASRPPTLLLVACRRKRCYGIRPTTVTGKEKKNYSGTMTSFQGQPVSVSLPEASEAFLEHLKPQVYKVCTCAGETEGRHSPPPNTTE